jgi:serine/threonine protein phosphatase PrpC
LVKDVLTPFVFYALSLSLLLGNPDIIEHKLTKEDEFIVLACDGIWDCMTNQEVVDYIRARIADNQALEDICEAIMDHCLAPDSEVGGVGCDNMSIIIVGILNGKTKDEWYEWMALRAPKTKKDALGNDIVEDTLPTSNNSNSTDTVDDKISLTSAGNPDPETAPTLSAP